MYKTLSLEDDKIVISEVIIGDDYKIANKSLKEIKLPPFVSVSCVYRYPHVIIPNGNTILMPNDKVLLVTTKENQEKIINLISEKSEVNE